MTRGQGFGKAASNTTVQSSSPRVPSILLNSTDGERTPVFGADTGPSIQSASAEDKAAFLIAARKAAAAQQVNMGALEQSLSGALRITDSQPTATEPPAEVVTPQPTENAPPAPAPETPAPAPSESSPGTGQESAPQETPAPSESSAEDPSAAIVMRVLQAFNQQTVDPLRTNLAEAETARQQAEQQARQQAEQIEQMSAQLADAQRSLSTFGDLQRLLGQGEPTESQGNSQLGAPAIMTTPTDSRLIGSAAELMAELDQSSRRVFNSSTNGYEILRDDRRANEFVKSHRADLIRDLEQSMKSSGLLQGSSRGRSLEQSAPTTMFDVIGGFLPVLSALMRTNNRSGKIWHQFPTTRINFLEGQGGTVQVPRVAYQPAPANPNARLLSGAGIYQGIVDENQSIQSGVVEVAVQEWGLGGTAAGAPIGIPTFVDRYSLIDLMEMLRRNLWQDYIEWEDMKARSLYAPTSRVVYNKGNRATTDETTLTAGSGGTATKEFVEALSDYAKTALIPTLPDGCYIWAIPTKYLTSLRESLDSDLLSPTTEDITIVKDYLSNSTGGMVDRISGYKGKIGNVHIFEGNSWGIGAAGTDGVQSETIDGGPKITRSGYFFGADTTGRGIGQEFNIRLQDGNVHFNRLTRAIWIEYSGWVALDVDPVGYADASAVPQQLRVIETRLLDEAI